MRGGITEGTGSMKTPGYDFDTPIDRSSTASLKWEKYAGTDIIPLWVADMDFRAPPEVLAALHRRVDHGVFGYTKPPGELNETVVRMLSRQFDWRVDEAWLIWLPGLVTGLNVACRAVGREGEAVATLTPVYPPFLSAPLHSGRRVVKVPLVEENNRWWVDVDRVEAALTPDTRLLLLCNPHNPVGRVLRRSELAALAELCLAHDLVICSDEIHCGLLLDAEKEHVPTATLGAEIADRTITLMAPSKTFNLPGLGCSFAVIPSEQLRRRFRQAMAGIVPMINAFGYEGALAAYRHGGPWQAALIDYLRDNRGRVQKAVSGMDRLSMAPVEATYLAWIDVRRSGLDHPVAHFEKYGIGLQDGAEFDGGGFVRLNFGCPASLLEEALRRMGRAVRQP